MKAYRKAIVPLFCLLLAVVVACGSDGTYMRQQLAELQDKNLADSLLTNDSLALNLCEYFDNHGTSNEKMLAHYLLGRTYADMGEAPRALDCYYDAISLADTTAADCDYHTLIGVYGQMSVIFHQQNLPQDEIQAIKQYAYYTLLLGDTINHIIYQSQLIAPYYILDEKDTVLQIIEDVNQQLEQRGCTDFPPLNLGTAAYIYTERGDLEKASEMLDKYESIDGMIDENHNIAAGWESYYWIKGFYELKIDNVDSAEYYFRKALPVNDIEVRFNAYKGLLKVYQLRQNIDSIANYSLLYENSLDSLHNRMRTDAISQSAALYGYTRSEKLIEQETQKRREAWYWFFGLLVCGLLAGVFAFWLYKNSQNEKRRLAERIQLLRGYAVNKNLYDSPVANHFRQLLKANPYHQPDAKDWKELTTLIETEIPGFRKALSNETYTPSDIEYDVCMLIKIQIPLSDIARLKHCVPSYITQIRKNVYKNLFSKKGSANELDEYIMQLC